MTDKLDQFVTAATEHVFATMVDWKVTTSNAQEGSGEPQPFSLMSINGSIGFGGKMTGSLFLSASDSLAGDIARQILGDTAGPTEVSDVIGEMTNMLAGSCKSRLCDAGYTVVMSIPNVIRGTRLWASSRDVQFIVRRTFSVPGKADDFQVVLLGKMS